MRPEIHGGRETDAEDTEYLHELSLVRHRDAQVQHISQMYGSGLKKDKGDKDSDATDWQRIP